MSSHPPETTDWIAHVHELRKRLLLAIVAILGAAFALMPFAGELYRFIAQPLLAHMPPGSAMVAITVAGPFVAPFKLTFILAIFVATPFLLFQGWRFIAPALYTHEKRRVLPLLIASTGLFYAGAAFAYVAILPWMFRFFSSMLPPDVQMMTDIGAYLDFVLAMLFTFGVIFQIPILVMVLIGLQLVSIQRLTKLRPYVIIMAFVIGMILTPPDVLSQILLAIPMCLLFELGLLLARVMRLDKR